ncbi:MAG: tRNA glutamyl-Q(34) synthetase GluQRS [Verrucomicrobiae bacterium]|nr:tRNA glutamyl-Q(34) synthetase GluQRS [Verrucomicrobiae bacterium]
MDLPSIVTRFAPSPTGLLHLGHAYSALFSFEAVRRGEGRFLLRIEDIDFTRCREEFEGGIFEDLEWLGLEWETPVRRQSEHLAEYAAVAEGLRERGLLYPCFCTRKDILREIERAGGAPHGVEGPLYPGTCRSLSEDERQTRIDAGDDFALRLDLGRALAEIGEPLSWFDRGGGEVTARPELLGDAVLVRKDIGTSYHLAVVHDDALQGITRVTRGKDLYEATHLHRVLQALLDLPVPEYHHHELVCDENGRRLAKRDESETLRSLREAGESPKAVRERLGFDF